MGTHTRRDVLRWGAAGAGALGLSQGFLSRVISAAADPLPPDIRLPAGFTYVKFSVFGDTMSDGNTVPFIHDGMGAFAVPNSDHIRLVRNHEIGESNDNPPGTALGDSAGSYDPIAPGGTVTVEYDPVNQEVVDSFVSLNGTDSNCAGGRTPWGTWLSCEETTVGLKYGLTQPHGYVFEVAANEDGISDARPIKAMGRFLHEAACVDQATGCVYMTEDQGPRDGFYRYRPETRGDLSTGTLQIMRVVGKSNYDTTKRQTVGASLPVAWITIKQPDPKNAETNPSAVFKEGHGKGAAEFIGGEGCCPRPGTGVYFNSGEGGAAGLGQIWEYVPSTNAGRLGEQGWLTLLYESSGFDDLDGPDNMTVSPLGKIVICEDGDQDPNFVKVLDPVTHHLSVFAENPIYVDLHDVDPDNYPEGSILNSEFAGATFSPDGSILFVNVQIPGATYAITGPFASLGI